MQRFILASLCSLSITLIPALAADIDYPKQVFDATYETKDTKIGNHSMRMVCDGKGHMRVESEAGGQKTVSIMDYPNKVCTTLIEAQHMAMRMPLTAPQKQITDEASAKREGAKSLGAKVVNGHPCHGYESSQSGGTSRVWIGDDTRYLVRSETITPNGTIAMDLKAWSTAQPSADMFVVPAGYKEMKLPIGAGQMPTQR